MLRNCEENDEFRHLSMAIKMVTDWAIRFFLWSLGFFALARVRTLSKAASLDGNRVKNAPLTEQPEHQESPSVSVIIPARNEAHNLPHLLASLRIQSLKPHEILVVDDGSADDGPEIAREFGATVLHTRPPGGWTGKSHACWRGACQADGDLLCFIDADVTLGPCGLERLVSAYRRHGGLVSILPRHITFRSYEALSALFNVVSAMGTGAFMLTGEPGRTSVASGPAMICAASDYHNLGGHMTIASEVVDDVALGSSFAAAGLPVYCFAGDRDITYRMYPLGINQLIEGWSKNFATGAARLTASRFAVVAAWITGALTAMFLMSGVITGTLARSLPVSALILSVTYYGLYALQIRYFETQLGEFPRWAAYIFPISLIFFGAVFLCSVTRTFLLRKVSWKGRMIRV